MIFQFRELNLEKNDTGSEPKLDARTASIICSILLAAKRVGLGHVFGYTVRVGQGYATGSRTRAEH